MGTQAARNRHSSLEMICPSLGYQDISYFDGSERERGRKQHHTLQLEHSPASIFTPLLFTISETSHSIKKL
jgi:hypothetical protein